MTPGALFRRCGMALFGPDPGYKVPFGLALGVKTDSIDGMAKGEKRIPPGVWADVRDLLMARDLEVIACAAAIQLLDEPPAPVVLDVAHVDETSRRR